MTSSEQVDQGTEAIRRFEEWRKRFNAALARREARVKTLVTYARSKGLDANPSMVDKHMLWFERWYAGMLATGYLMNRTGVKFIVRDGVDDRTT